MKPCICGREPNHNEPGIEFPGSPDCPRHGGGVRAYLACAREALRELFERDPRVLPFTGLDLGLGFTAAVLLLAIGVGLRRFGRRLS